MYFRFGNTAGAYASLIVGTVVSDGGNPYAAELGRFHLSMARTGGMAGKHRCRSGDGFGTFSALYRLADGCFCMALLFAAPSVRNSGSLFFGGNSVDVLFRSFSMRRNGSTHRLDCIDGVSHVFGGGGFEKCELRNQGRGELQHHASGKAQTERQRINLPVRERNGNRRTPIPLHLRNGK